MNIRKPGFKLFTYGSTLLLLNIMIAHAFAINISANKYNSKLGLEDFLNIPVVLILVTIIIIGLVMIFISFKDKIEDIK